MNIATKFLHENWTQLGLGRALSPERLSWVVLTPSFPASSHILFFVLSESTSDPLFVMKVSRVPGEDRSLKREAANLVLVHSARDGGFPSIPRMLDFRPVGDTSMLVETALLGTQMDRAFVRGNTKWSIESVLRWVVELHSSTAVSSRLADGWFARLVEEPILRLASFLSPTKDEQELIDEVFRISELLRKKDFPLVFSHGDLSDPNILVLRKGGVGVVDWETAEPKSLPAADLFFFLNFVTSSVRPANRVKDCSAFRETFSSPDSWARDYVARYADALNLERELLKPLFVLCFTRSLNSLASRIGGHGAPLDRESLAILKAEPAYRWWRTTVEHVDDLCLA